ncbi:UNVERIFIED_CONTAM: PLDc_N domain-containing protein [Streptococcus canis]
MNFLLSNIHIILPILVINIILVIVSLRDLFKNETCKFGNRIFWMCVILFIQIVGPIVYLLFGRDD